MDIHPIDKQVYHHFRLLLYGFFEVIRDGFLVQDDLLLHTLEDELLLQFAARCFKLLQAFFGRVGYDALLDGFENVVDGFVDLCQFLLQQLDGIFSKQFRVVLPVYLIYDQSKVCARQGVLQGLKDDVVQQVFLYEFCRAVLLAYGVPALVVFGHAPGLGCAAVRSHPRAALSAIYAPA